MSDENKVAARRILESYNQGQQAAKRVRDELFAPDVVVHFPGMPGPVRGRTSFEPLIEMFARSFTDDHITIEDQVAEGDMVATRWEWAFSHTADFQGIPPTGKRVTMSGINFERFSGGKLVERWVQMDQISMMQQLGAMPPQ